MFKLGSPLQFHSYVFPEIILSGETYCISTSMQSLASTDTKDDLTFKTMGVQEPVLSEKLSLVGDAGLNDV